MTEILWLAESEHYKVYSIYENVYVKDKRTCNFQDKFENADDFVQWIYGEPTGAIILPTEKHIVIVGCGIVIYNTNNKRIGNLFGEPKNINWIDAVFQVEADNPLDEFRFVGFNKLNKTRVFKYNIQTELLGEVE